MGLFGWSMPAGCSRVPADDEGAIEIQVDGKWYAWTESEQVFVYTGHDAERDDGYSFFCNLKSDWMAEDETPESYLKRHILSKIRKPAGV